MDDPKHHEDCMCDDCIKFQGLVESGEAEYEEDALRAEIVQLKAAIAQAVKDERDRCVETLRREHHKCVDELVKYGKLGDHDKADAWANFNAQTLVCMDIIEQSATLEADHDN